jgi:hypothetical protein
MRTRRAASMSLPNRVATLALGLMAVLAAGLIATSPASAASPSPASSPAVSPAGSGSVAPSGSAAGSAGPSPTATRQLDLVSVPVLAYYYIWFDPNSWNRAKTDMPLLGPYSSDDEAVMRQHITWAKAAGIDGFIVSWKNTTVLDRRLELLMRVANEMDFKLAIIYEGLDFSRNPLPATQVADDLDFFLANYAADPVFDVFGKPMVIWSGTWEFSATDIASVTGPRRDRLLILASERSVDGYARVASEVDGDAYYWSSVNPDTFTDYETKLYSMSAAVHDAEGLWIAPAAPGFDARLVGGTTVVDRQDGQMLARQMQAAVQSLPDAVGIISWNEFSENSQIEPSRNYGDRSLQVLAGLRKTNLSTIGDIDSSSPGGVDSSAGVGRLLAIGAVLGIGFAGAAITIRRRMRVRRHRAVR